MPKYERNIPIPGRSQDEIYEKISGGIDRFLSGDTARWGQFQIERNPEKKEVSLKSKFATATLICRAAEVELDANLSFIALPFRSKIDESIDRWLKKTFPTQAS